MARRHHSDPTARMAPQANSKAVDKPRPLRRLDDMDDVVIALGGREGVLALTGRKNNNLTNWLTIQRKFPAWSFLLMQRELVARGFEAPPSLWGIADPPPPLHDD